MTDQKEGQGMTARAAILAEIETAEEELNKAGEEYVFAERKLHEAQKVSAGAYDRRAEKAKKLRRLRKALRALDGEDES